MALTVRLDPPRFENYYQQLAVVLRQSLPRTLRFEAAATVARAMKMTKTARVPLIRRSAAIAGIRDKMPSGTIRNSVNTGSKGGQEGLLWGFSTKTNRAFALGVWDFKTKRFLTRRPASGGFSHVSRTLADVWKKKMVLVALNIELKLEARGIDQKSWYGIIEKLGNNQVQVPEFVRRARPINGRVRTVSFAATEGANTPKPVVVIANTSGVASATGGSRKLASAITIRRKFFRNSMKKGFFEDAKFVAKNYKWATVSE
jgi:hypothetical protein